MLVNSLRQLNRLDRVMLLTRRDFSSVCLALYWTLKLQNSVAQGMSSLVVTSYSGTRRLPCGTRRRPGSGMCLSTARGGGGAGDLAPPPPPQGQTTHSRKTKKNCL